MVCPGVVRKAAKLVPTVLQALALVVFIHVVGQGLLTRYGSARYRFSNRYQGAAAGFSNNKVSKVIKYIDKNIPRYSPKPVHSKNKGKQKEVVTRPSTTSTTPAPPPPLAELEKEQQKRVTTLREGCTKYGMGQGEGKGGQEAQEMLEWFEKQKVPRRPLWQNLICSKEHRMSLCPVYKSASTFLLKKFLLIAPSGKYDKESVNHLEAQANVLARKEFGYLDSWTQYPDFTSNGTSIIFVRHPFERLLSAFRDKLEDPGVQGKKFNEYYYNKYGRRIVMHFRKHSVTGPTWKYPRFDEFLDYLLSKDLRYDDEHWSPYYKECTTCNINYTFVGHFETLYWDIHLLANKTGLTSKWDDKSDYFQSSTYRAVSEEYFATVDKDVIRKLYQRYKLDFELFGYSPDDYIKMGKPGPDDVVEEPVKTQDDAVSPEAKDKSIAQSEGKMDTDIGEIDSAHNSDSDKAISEEIVDEKLLIVLPEKVSKDENAEISNEVAVDEENMVVDDPKIK